MTLGNVAYFEKFGRVSGYPLLIPRRGDPMWFGMSWRDDLQSIQQVGSIRTATWCFASSRRHFEVLLLRLVRTIRRQNQRLHDQRCQPLSYLRGWTIQPGATAEFHTPNVLRLFSTVLDASGLIRSCSKSHQGCCSPGQRRGFPSLLKLAVRASVARAVSV